MKIQILKKNKQFYWRMIASNGRTVCHSETYSSRAKAVKTVNSVWKYFKNYYGAKLSFA